VFYRVPRASNLASAGIDGVLRKLQRVASPRRCCSRGQSPRSLRLRRAQPGGGLAWTHRANRQRSLRGTVRITGGTTLALGSVTTRVTDGDATLIRTCRRRHPGPAAASGSLRGRVIRRRLILTVETGPPTTKLVIPLSHAGLKALHRHHRRRIRVLVTFVATQERGSGTAANPPTPVVNPPSTLLCGYFSCVNVPTELPAIPPEIPRDPRSDPLLRQLGDGRHLSVGGAQCANTGLPNDSYPSAGRSTSLRTS